MLASSVLAAFFGPGVNHGSSGFSSSAMAWPKPLSAVAAGALVGSLAVVPSPAEPLPSEDITHLAESDWIGFDIDEDARGNTTALCG
jgi:hypothetical protein